MLHLIIYGSGFTVQGLVRMLLVPVNPHARGIGLFIDYTHAAQLGMPRRQRNVHANIAKRSD